MENHLPHPLTARQWSFDQHRYVLCLCNVCLFWLKRIYSFQPVTILYRFKKTLLSTRNLSKIMVFLWHGYLFFFFFAAECYFCCSFFCCSFCRFQNPKTLFKVNIDLKFGSLFHGVFIFTFALKFAYADKTSCIMDFQNYNVLTHLPILEKRLQKLFQVWYTQVRKQN